MCLSDRHVSFGATYRDGGRMPFAEPGVKPHYAPSRNVRIEHAHIHLSFEPVAGSFSGSAVLKIHAMPAYSGHFSLNLDDVDLGTVKDEEGNDLDHSYGDGKIVIRSQTAPASVTVTWSAAKSSRGLYFTGPTDWEPERQHMCWTQCQDEDAHFVFPCHDHPGVKHPWTIELDAPAGYTLLSNGEQVSQSESDGRSRARFEQAEPMPAYLFTAVAAKLSVVESSWRDRSVRYLVPVGQEEAVVRAFGKTPLMMEAFSQRIGVDYPWPRYDQVVVHDFIFGGMENIACTTMTDLLLVTEDAILDWDPDGLVAHELAHQWFGDLVTCQDWSQGWLNESWATVMEAVWWETDRTAEEAIWYRWETANGYFAEHGGRYRRPIVSYDFREPIDVFDRHLYNKGSCVLWTLRAELGEEAFWSGVKGYLNRHRHQTVHTRHFQRAIEEASGRNLDGFFHQWVHSPGHPLLDVTLAATSRLLTVDIKQTQGADDGVPEAFDLTLNLEVVYEDGDVQTIALPVAEKERSWAVPVSKPVATVRVDPTFQVLAQITLHAPDAWLKSLLNDACPVLSVRAARALMASDSPRAVELVATALTNHGFHAVRSALAGALGKRGGQQALDALCDALPNEEDPRVRAAISGALGGFPQLAAADALLADAERSFPTVQLHGAFLEALGQTRDSRALELISEDLDDDGWAFTVTRRGLAGLGASRNPEAMDVLLAHSQTGRPDRVRGAAAAALGTLADKCPDLRDSSVERLIEMLREPGFTAQLVAIATLGRLRDEKALGPLSQMHHTAPDGRTRRSAYEAMVRIREGRDSEKGLALLQRRLEELETTNQKLRSRIDKLEITSAD